jgi:hypothetical protein
VPLGIGLAPLGTCLAGFGVVDTAEISAPAIFKKPDGTQGNAALLVPNDEGKLDYVVDASGQKVGADSVPMMVLLALKTAKGTSIDGTLGLDVSAMRQFSGNSAQAADTAVRNALASLVKRKLITVLSVTFERAGTNAAKLFVSWMDLTNGEKNLTDLLLGS